VIPWDYVILGVSIGKREATLRVAQRKRWGVVFRRDLQ
jgi:hypothetical protein